MTDERSLRPAGQCSPGASPSGPSTASGRTLTTQGWPVSGATVTVIGPDGRQQARAISGDDGEFSLAGLVPGPSTLLVAAPSHQPQARTVTVPTAVSWSLGDVTLTRDQSATAPVPGLYVIDTAHSTVSARAHHLGLATVTGRFTDFAGAITVEKDLTRSRVDADIVAASIDTGNRQRDDHLRSADFLDVTTFPTLRFESDHVERRPDGWSLPGRLTLIGVTRPVELTLTYLGSGPDPWGGMRAAFTATTQLRRRDFHLRWNQAVEAGVAVFGTTLKVSLDVEAVLQG